MPITRRRARRGLGLRASLCAPILIAALAGAGPLRAEGETPPTPAAWSPLDTIFALPPVRVEGEPLRRRLAAERETLARAVILPAAHPRRLAAPAALIAELPGVELRSLGGLGSFSTASFRGSGSEEVAVLVDGLDLRSPFSGLALLDELPLVGVQRLEVYRGGVPAELGAAGAAGAVNLVTGGERGLRATLGTGSFGTRRGGFSWLARGPASTELFLAGGLLASDADYRYLDRNGTVFSNTADDTLRLRANADIAARDLLARFSWAPAAGRAGGRWTLAYRYLARENGVPGTESLPTQATRSARSGHDGRLVWESPLLARRLLLGAEATARLGWTRFVNPLGETGPFLVADETRDRLAARGALARGQLLLGPLHLLLRGEAREERFLPDNLNPAKPESFERERNARRGETEARLSLAGERLLLLAGYGTERLADNYFGPPPLPWLPALPKPEHLTRARSRRTGASWRALARANTTLTLRANAADLHRAPSLLELFGQDVSVSGNPALRPERGTQADAGFALALRRGGLKLDGECSWFRRDLEDEILMLRNSQYSVRAENIGASRTTGRETSLALAWRALRASLAETRLAARDRGGLAAYDGKQLPYRSPRRLHARLGWEGERLGLFAERESRAATFSDRYNDPDRRLPAAALWSAGANLRVNGNLNLSIEGRNLGDTRVEDHLGYPLPGRHWLAGLTWAHATTTR